MCRYICTDYLHSKPIAKWYSYCELHQQLFAPDAGSVSFTATGGASYQFRIDGVIAQAWSASSTFTHTFTDDGVVTVDVANGR